MAYSLRIPINLAIVSLTIYKNTQKRENPLNIILNLLWLPLTLRRTCKEPSPRMKPHFPVELVSLNPPNSPSGNVNLLQSLYLWTNCFPTVNPAAATNCSVAVYQGCCHPRNPKKYWNKDVIPSYMNISLSEASIIPYIHLVLVVVFVKENNPSKSLLLSCMSWS